MSAEQAQGLKYVLMDIDDTLTRDGKLLACSYQALWDLKDAGLRIIPITGRPAGWCSLIAREWPVDGVVGENGALAFWEQRGAGERPSLRQLFHRVAVKNSHPALERVRERAIAAVPGLRVAKDQFARLFDLALDFAEEEPVLPLSAAERVRAIALEEGARAKVSSIHVNVWMGDYDKLSMAQTFLSERLGWDRGTGMAEALFIGDSPNDEPMFAAFPLSCAVANIRRYHISHLPAFVSTLECGEGFTEIVRVILSRRYPAAHEQPD